MRIDNIRNLQASPLWRCLQVAFLFFVFQLISVSSSWSADGDCLSLPKLKIVPGTVQKLAIQLKNSNEYTAFQADFYFPNGISPVKDASAGYTVSLSSRKADHSISANVVSDGGLRVAAYSMNNSSFTGNSGDLFYIDIVSESTYEGEGTIEVKDILFTRTSDRKEIAFDNTTCTVNTKESLKGDANQDGAVNVTDIVATVNFIMENPTGTFDFEAADVNEDGAVNVTDIVGMVNIIMSSGSRMEQQETMAVLKEYGFIFKGDR